MLNRNDDVSVVENLLGTNFEEDLVEKKKLYKAT